VLHDPEPPQFIGIEEPENFLHPRLLRELAEECRASIARSQLLVTTHSPFVINSCPGSRVHVLELDEQGRAHARPPVDAPIGSSVTATLKDIFGVDSRFDIRTEKELDEWNEIKKKEASGKLSSGEKRRLQQLTAELSARSEELRSIVGSPPRLSRTLVRSLTGKSRAVARR
jgi:predicted ATP-binding protein involved in virulence